MEFTEKEKELAKRLKEAGLQWEPAEGDWFWAIEDVSHQFYLGESLPSSFFFRQGECHVFDSSMTWHIQQGGLKLDRFVWLPTWGQCRKLLKENKFALQLHDHDQFIQIEAKRKNEKLTAQGSTDMEALYPIMLEMLKTR